MDAVTVVGSRAVPMRPPSVPVISNVTALPTTDAATIRLSLIAQITAPVLWHQSVMYCVDSLAMRTWTELGPVPILSPMLRDAFRLHPLTDKTDKTDSVRINALSDAQSTRQFIDLYKLGNC